jgi:hypothetical protein
MTSKVNSGIAVISRMAFTAQSKLSGCRRIQLFKSFKRLVFVGSKGYKSFDGELILSFLFCNDRRKH